MWFGSEEAFDFNNAADELETEGKAKTVSMKV